MYDIEGYLKSYTEVWGDEVIFQAAKYSLLSKGKRIRPILAIEAYKVVGGVGEYIMPFACALEMVHASSLVLDDIMDNDDIRRGQPACHKEYGVNAALMASQFLCAEAYLLITNPRCMQEILRTVHDMCIGQDTGNAELKTGSLICASVRIGGIVGGASEKQLNVLTLYGYSVGYLFQIRDDILDGDRPYEKLELDLSYLDLFGSKADKLREIARFVVERTE